MDMVRKHPEYKWNIGEEVKYFLLALEELNTRLQDKEIRWVFHNQCFLFYNGSKIAKVESKQQRKKEHSDMGPYVQVALNCMSANKSYDVWKRYLV